MANFVAARVFCFAAGPTIVRDLLNLAKSTATRKSTVTGSRPMIPPTFLPSSRTSPVFVPKGGTQSNQR